MKLALPILAALALAAGAVSAADKPKTGFDALDKNNDGYLGRAEARGNPYLKKQFDAADGNNDGRLNRAEYVAEMAKKDVKTGAARVERGLDRSASSGR